MDRVISQREEPKFLKNDDAGIINMLPSNPMFVTEDGSVCSLGIESTRQGLHGVKRATIALATEIAEVEFHPSLVILSQLLESSEDMGFEVSVISSDENTTNFFISNSRIHSEKKNC
ncbi:hypothetical protein C5167_014580 [Papaver somniferum]|uniref:Uncharacterized protein n=1 Tax=Papaver somniferum TaxID=3469 RepID=A0A4Y7J722_PAPSO|nr:hypothetical protein C5167_014580 [Papaver somniferum]